MMRISNEKYNELLDLNGTQKVSRAKSDKDICYIHENIACLLEDSVEIDGLEVYNVNVFKICDRDNSLRHVIEIIRELYFLGVKGIFITKRWHSFRKFFKDHIHKETENYTVYKLDEKSDKRLKEWLWEH